MSVQDLPARAQADGVKLNVAGNFGRVQTETATSATPPSKQTAHGVYNVGATLFRSALIIFCMIAFESLLVYFLKDYLKVSVAYPAVGFAVGFVLFAVCAVLHACGYKTHARRGKHPTYIWTATIVFVITVIIVTMIAVYFKAQIFVPSQLLAYVIFPVIYLLNILFFVTFYYLFSKKDSQNK